MRVVRVREKSPAPDGLRRVYYAYGCVDLTGAGLEPYLMKGGFFWIAFRTRPLPKAPGGRISPSALQGCSQGKPGQRVPTGD